MSPVTTRLTLSLVLLLALPLFFCLLDIAQAKSALRVILMTEHKEDCPWSELAREGLAQAVQDFGIQAAIAVEANPEKQERALALATKKADLVLLISERFHEILRDTARSYPATRFGVLDAAIRGANIHSIHFADEKASFLAGAAAALYAKSRRAEPAIGWISGEDIPALQSLFNGFREGAKLAVPEVRVIHGLVGSFTNPARAAKEADRLIAEGVDVLALAAGAGNAGILEKAKAAGILVIGLDCDERASYPGHVLTSITKDVKGAVYRLVQETVLGRFQGKTVEVLDLGSGVDIVDPAKSLGGEAKRLLPLGFERRLRELRLEIQRGAIQIKSFRRRTLCNCLE
ncbi:MAG: BMP family ABC transporter substrate-binding protein [Desulfovibrionaceae bacterium]|nr:BMP family ABC transporter substrate-binding protein [Desulfovibrionaceae bacterium]